MTKCNKVLTFDPFHQSHIQFALALTERKEEIRKLVLRTGKENQYARGRSGVHEDLNIFK